MQLKIIVHTDHTDPEPVRELDGVAVADAVPSEGHLITFRGAQYRVQGVRWNLLEKGVHPIELHVAEDPPVRSAT
jgi:hypothetical protein